jgi:GT2 family glycosyltransferase
VPVHRAGDVLIATGVVDAAGGAADLGAAARWRLLVLWNGRPCADLELPGPGPTRGGAFYDAAVRRHADLAVARAALTASLDARLALPAAPPVPPVTCSVVVCTHGRPDDLRELLASFVQLDPRPLELIVVDNAPGDRPCRDVVEAAGARYVREDRRGLDNARNAGIRAACGDVVVFTDDDCIVPPGWLRDVPGLFANPAVAAVTGPAFPLLLDTPSRVRMERRAGMSRGVDPIAFDWLGFFVLFAGAVGVGANMAFRRDVLLELGDEPFPPELDVGTATESGGDTYVLSRILAFGRRVLYEPGLYIHHKHRSEPDPLLRAMHGYGVGVAAALTKLLVEERELAAPRAWWWLVEQYLQTQRRRLMGMADPVDVRLAWLFARGAVAGPLRWLRAERAGPPLPARREPALAPVAPTGPPVSVIVPTFRRTEPLHACLTALARDGLPPGSEVIVVDDSPEPVVSAAAFAGLGLALRVVHSAGRGAAGARNAGAASATGEVLLFLDDDVVPAPGLVARHLDHHGPGAPPALVVAPYLPEPQAPGLAALAVGLWWNDLFHALGRAPAPAFTGAVTGNVSMRRDEFARIGGFDEAYGNRREDWEWGLRAAAAGVQLRYEPAAVAAHRYTLDTGSRLRGAFTEGRGDALLARRHPETVAAIHAITTPLAGARTALLASAWTAPGVEPAVLAVLDALERARLRRAWLAVFARAQRASYGVGLRAGDAPEDMARREVIVDVELTVDTPLPRPGAAVPTLRLLADGDPVGLVRPALGQWTADLAGQIVAAVPARALGRIAAARGILPAAAPEHPGRGHVWVAPADGWAAAARAGAAVVAVPLAGVTLEPRALDEALAALDADGVGLVTAAPLADGAPLAPLWLDDTAPNDIPEGPVAAFVLARREVLALLDEPLLRRGGPDALDALLARATEAGWVRARRDVHGIAGAGPSRAAHARALGARRADGRPGVAAARALARLARDVARGRGEAVRDDLGALAGALLSVRRSSDGRAR